MYHLATIFPLVRKIRIPINRDQIMLLMLALNEMLMGVETFTAHLISGTIVPYEWIPIIFGPIAALLIVVGLLIGRRRKRTGTILQLVIFALSGVVGFLGAYFHLNRSLLLDAAVGEQLSVPLLVWGVPMLAPLTFSLVGLLGVFALWMEDPTDSGRWVLNNNRKLHFPLSKTRFYFLLVSLGCLATVVSSVLDHARTNFSNPWLWLPTAVGVLAVVVAIGMGMISVPHRGDLGVYLAAMLLMILTGFVGVWLHIERDLTAAGILSVERLLRIAPPMAPMLFADLGSIGLIVLLDPKTINSRPD